MKPRLPAAAAALLLLLPTAAAASPDDEVWNGWRPRLDVEPAAWFLGGYSVHVGVQPPAAPRLLLSVGAYAFEVPDLLLDLAGNDPAALDVRLYLGYGATVDYFLDASADDGWVVGGQLGAQHHQTTVGSETRRYVNALILLRAGYEWHPGGHGGYVFPWLGAAFTPRLSGDASDVDTLPVTPYLTIDVGWRL